MAYKFQFGTTKLSGSTTFEEALVGESSISGSGRVSGKELILDAVGVIGTSGDLDLLTLSNNKLEVAGDLSASIALQGPDLVLKDTGGRIGTAADVDLMTLGLNLVTVAGGVDATTLSGSSTLSIEGVSSFGPGALTTISAAGVISGSGASTLHSVDADELTTEKLTVTSTFSATTLSASLGITGSSLEVFAEGGGTLPFFKAQNGILSGSGVSTLYSVTTDALIAQTADINGGTADAVVIGGGTAAAGTFTTVTVNDALDVNAGATITGDTTDEITLDVQGVDSQTALAFRVRDSDGNVDVDVTAAGVTTLRSLVATTADINAGTIDNTAIGGTTQAAGEFTTLSASSTLNIVGASTFGPASYASISAAGVISGSGASTLHSVSSNQLIFASSSLNGPAYINKLATSVDEIMGLTSGSILYHDEATGLQKLGSFASYALAIAGTGITATNGQLSVDTTGGDSMSSTHIPFLSYGNAVLSTGVNYMSQEATGSCLLVLPSGSAGDVVIVKSPTGVSSTNFVKITSSVANANEIDGFSEARIESPYGAVSLIYVEAGSEDVGQWVIYQTDIVLQFLFWMSPERGASFFLYYLK